MSLGPVAGQYARRPKLGKERKMVTPQRASETEIRELIERWAAAVQARDLGGVLADHSDDIQMFDVPPPNEVRGIEAYRDTWPPFF
jgi:ketosteroid isomerase-like protein